MSNNGIRIGILSIALSATGLVGIALQERYVDTARPPVAGDVPTYGFGTTTHDDGSPLQAGEKTTPEKALAKALRDVQVTESGLKKCIKVPLTQGEYDALVSLAYNVGAGRVCASSIPAKLAAGDYAAACRTILDFDGFRDCSKPKVENPRTGKLECPLVKLRGLTIRRQAEYQRCTGETP